jgi:hypothetical protein
MRKRVAYDDLPLIPSIVAESVAQRPYTGNEMPGGIPQSFVSQVERDRLTLTRDDIRAFAKQFDSLCRAAYEAKAEWFMACVRSKTNAGRDQLYVWATHQFASFVARRGEYCA